MKGFTLTELLVTIAILGFLAVFLNFNLFGYRGFQELDLTAQEIVAVLRNAQNRSISQESGNRFGVHFENSVSNEGFYDLFSGTSYSGSALINKSALRPTIQFLEPASGNSNDVIFTPITGLPNASTTIKISLKRDVSVFKTIIINSNGQIQY